MNPLDWNRETVIRNAILALCLVCIGLVVHEVFGTNGLLAMRRQQHEAQTIQQKIDQLKQENQKLEEQVKGLQSDPQAIEKQAREELHLARPGELIYTLPDKGKKSPANK